MLVEKRTEFGTASWKITLEDDVVPAAADVLVQANEHQTYLWANCTGYSSCSDLAGQEIVAIFTHNGLMDISFGLTNISSAELSAWSSDVLCLAGLPKDHPAWDVTVGQFQ